MRKLLVAILTVALGCTPKVVEWEDTKRIEDVGPEELELTIRNGAAAFGYVLDETPLPMTENECPGSMRLAHGPRNEVHAIWWEVQPDSTARLYSARSRNSGGEWGPKVIVDSTDIRKIGCSRAAASIDVDQSTGYIHTVYALENATGAGVFFSHSMEGGALFHSPVAIVYGESPTVAEVAADADRVVVAYEDPNMRVDSPGRIALAVSATSGHIFELRVPVSTGTGTVRAPQVALDGHKVAVAWIEKSSGSEKEYRVTRTGQLKADRPTAVQTQQAKEVSHPPGHTGAVPAQP